MKPFISFSKTLNFECLMLEIYSKHNLQNKKIGKAEKEDDTFLKKKKKTKTKCCYHNDVCRWKRYSFNNEVKITR